MSLMYFSIAIGATIIGSASGLGGGIIIKPILDFLGHYNVVTISVLSCFTVFFMAVVSVIHQIRNKTKINFRRTGLIGIGAIIGGILGDQIMTLVLSIINELIVSITQSIILAILFILIYIYMNNKEKYKSYNVKNWLACISIGILLGTIASFLSIGGGPINVCILTIFFSMNPKEAAVDAVAIMLFSQGSKLASIVQAGSIHNVDIGILLLMIAGGILGGLIGSKLNKKMKSEEILKMFNVFLVILIVLNIYNVFNVLAF